MQFDWSIRILLVMFMHDRISNVRMFQTQRMTDFVNCNPEDIGPSLSTQCEMLVVIKMNVSSDILVVKWIECMRQHFFIEWENDWNSVVMGSMFETDDDVSIVAMRHAEVEIRHVLP